MKSLSALISVGVAFSLNVPDASLLWKFFGERISLKEDISSSSLSSTVFGEDTFSCLQYDTIRTTDTIEEERFFSYGDCGMRSFPFSIDIFVFLEPIELSTKTPISLTVNKTRTKINNTMCWKLKVAIDDRPIDIYLSADGFFRIIRLERKQSGESRSDDIWEFREIRRGWDIPCKMTRSVSFEWGGKRTEIISRRELLEIKPIGAEGKF